MEDPKNPLLLNALTDDATASRLASGISPSEQSAAGLQRFQISNGLTRLCFAEC